jgi:hypothetical protein
MGLSCYRWHGYIASIAMIAPSRRTGVDSRVRDICFKMSIQPITNQSPILDSTSLSSETHRRVHITSIPATNQPTNKWSWLQVGSEPTAPSVQTNQTGAPGPKRVASRSVFRKAGPPSSPWLGLYVL